jgi:hypothetical protein
MNERLKWLPWLLVCVLMLVGCGDKKSGNGGDDSGGGGLLAAPADTPKAVCVNFVKAVETGNQDLFLDSLTYEDKDEEMLVAMFGTISAGQKLHVKALEAYGPEGAELLVKNSSFPTVAEIEEKVTIEESGDTAKAILPDQNEPLELVKVDGVWKAKLPEKDLPPAEQRPQAIAMMQTLASVMNEAAEKVGKEGYTAEKIEKEMAAAMQKAMQEMMQKQSQ